MPGERLGKLRRGLAGASLLGVAMLALPSAPAETARSDLALDYDVYVGGLHMLHAETTLALADDRYAIRLDATLRGLPAMFTEWWAVTAAAGAITPDALQPERHTIRRLHRGEVKNVEIAFAPGGPVAVSFDPLPDDLEPIEPALLEGAIDPLSSLVAVIDRLTAGGTCAGTLAAYDGRRRYDLIFTEGGPGRLDPSRYGLYSGPALRCDMRLVPIAGDWDWNDQDAGRPPERHVEIWLARPLPDGPMVPVRIRGEAWIGHFLIHLSGAAPIAPSLDSATLPAP